MSRDTTAWSVKGVDQATRDIARRAAAAAGMTIGEWIDHAIKSDSANRGILVPADREGAPRSAAAQRVDGISADTVEAIFSRISDGERLFEARLRPIGYALKDVAERVVALEREAERLPPPETSPPVMPEPPVIEPVVEVEPERPQSPVRTPIAFRPMRTPEQPPPPPAPEPTAEEDIWDSEPSQVPPAEPERQIPPPIVFRPVPTADPEAIEEEEDFDSIDRDIRPVPALPDGPPADWRPDFEVDRTALAFAAGDFRDRTTEPPVVEPERPDLDAVELEAEAWEPSAPEEIPTPPVAEPEVVTKSQRPDPVAPAHDFPADPIDTRSLGLSGEAIPEPLPPRRIASRGRLAIAAALALALLGGAAWTAHRQGTLSLGAIGERLAEAENSVHLALTEATDWVMHQVGSEPRLPEEVVAPRPTPTVPPETVASAPARDTAREVTPRPDAPEPARPAETAAPTPSETQNASAAGTATQPAPPLPEKTIDVDPRHVAPPPAPALAEPPRRASAAAAPLKEPSAPLSRAEAGNPAAQFEVAAGMMRAAEPRPAEAATWFREAAINGLDVAQFNLGVMYEQGLGVPMDETRALLWYHSAAEQGYPLAQYNLGRLYALGKGIPQSDAEAKRWFQRAADRGVSDGLYEVARFEPEGLERERLMYNAAKAGAEQAQEWLRVKSAGGVPDAPMGPAAGLMLDPPTGAPDIAEIQEGLAGLGYYDGPVDGIAGPMTRAAISRFQSDNGLPATGLPSRSLRQRLN